MTEREVDCVLKKRLQAATPAELNRLCLHLDLKEGANNKEIEKAYLNAADNSISNALRKVVTIPNNSPTYSKALHLIFNEIRPYSVTLNNTWKRVKHLKFRDYRSEIEDIDDKKLEEQILSMYAVKYADVKDKLITDPNFWNKIGKLFPGGSATAVAATIAPRALAGPIGLGLAVILIGSHLAGPAYRKIIPATIELILIGRRIDSTPKD